MPFWRLLTLFFWPPRLQKFVYDVLSTEIFVLATLVVHIFFQISISQFLSVLKKILATNFIKYFFICYFCLLMKLLLFMYKWYYVYCDSNSSLHLCLISLWVCFEYLLLSSNTLIFSSSIFGMLFNPSVDFLIYLIFNF